MPKWCSWTCAWVHARVRVRSKVRLSRYLSARSRTSSRVEATMVEKIRCAVVPGGIWTVRRRLIMGSSTEPTEFERGRPSIIDTALRKVRARPTNFARSVSNCKSPVTAPLTTRTCAAHTAVSSGERLRLVASIAPRSDTNSVSTNRFEKAGCAISAACEVSESSA